MIHTPGLSFLKAMARYPLAGREATSRRGGLIRFSSLVARSKVPADWPITQKS